jgi:hypothetical protein
VAALERLAVAHQGEGAYYEAYRHYHLSQGAFDGRSASAAATRVEKTVYDAMWG